MLAKFWDGFLVMSLFVAVLAGLFGVFVWAVTTFGVLVGFGVLALVVCVLTGIAHMLLD